MNINIINIIIILIFKIFVLAKLLDKIVFQFLPYQMFDLLNIGVVTLSLNLYLCVTIMEAVDYSYNIVKLTVE